MVKKKKQREQPVAPTAETSGKKIEARRVAFLHGAERGGTNRFQRRAVETGEGRTACAAAGQAHCAEPLRDPREGEPEPVQALLLLLRPKRRPRPFRLREEDQENADT